MSAGESDPGAGAPERACCTQCGQNVPAHARCVAAALERRGGEAWAADPVRQWCVERRSVPV